jgi:hypothetical protein
MEPGGAAPSSADWLALVGASPGDQAPAWPKTLFRPSICSLPGWRPAVSWQCTGAHANNYRSSQPWQSPPLLEVIVDHHLIGVEECEQLSGKAVQSLYRDYVSRSQVSLTTTFGFGKQLIEKAEGPWLYPREGKRILDFTGGVGVLNHGHNHPRILAVRRQFAERQRMEAHKAFLSPYVAALSHNVARLLPGDLNISLLSELGRRGQRRGRLGTRTRDAAAGSPARSPPRWPGPAGRCPRRRAGRRWPPGRGSARTRRCGGLPARDRTAGRRGPARTASASGPSSVITARRPVALAASGRHSATLCAQWPPALTERSKATGSSCGLAVIRIAPRAVDAVTASGPAASSTARLRRARTGPSRQPLTAARSPRASWQGRRRPPPAGPRARWAPRPGRRTTAGSRPRLPGRRPDRPARWSQSRRPNRRRRRTGLR